jgi:hypothetical protein
MYDTLEKRLTAAGQRTTKLQLAFDALEFANGNVSKAKAIIAESGVRISSRTWYKAICIRLAHLTEEERRLNNVYNAFIGR